MIHPAARNKPQSTFQQRRASRARREPTPRLPDRPAPCNSFWSCGLETIPGLQEQDFEDEQHYARQERERLMNQASIIDKSGCQACSSPGDPNLKLGDPDGQGAPIRP